MVTYSIKIFQPFFWLKFFFVSILFIFQLVILFVILSNKFDSVADRIKDIILMESFVLVALLAVLQITTEKVFVTCNAVVRETIYRKQTFPLSTITLIKKVCVGRGSYALYIKTDHSVFKIGQGLMESQINEAVLYIRERILILYPESYALMKDD